MTKVNQTHDELKKHLEDSIGFLELSGASFDAGFLGEAKRLATTIRVLTHDTSNSKSLLGLLNIKDNIKYITTAIEYDPKSLTAYHGLVGLRFGSSGASYWAPLGDGPPDRYNRSNCDFDTWWKETVIVDKIGGKFTRRELALSLANKDGGAHVDPKLNAKYAALTRSNSLGWVASDGVNKRPFADIELYSVRQIAYELLLSLGKHKTTPA